MNAGQWWFPNDAHLDRMFVVGVDTSGITVFQNRNGVVFRSGITESDWWHEPECTGWLWVKEMFPQWWTTTNKTDPTIAFVRRNSATDMTIVRRDGAESAGYPWSSVCGNRERLTEDEALALLDPPAEPKRIPVRLLSHSQDGIIITVSPGYKMPVEWDELFYDASTGFYLKEDE